jgi:hypothetical protein
VPQGGKLPGENSHGTHLKRSGLRVQRTRRWCWLADSEDVEPPASNARRKVMDEAASIKGEWRQHDGDGVMVAYPTRRRRPRAPVTRALRWDSGKAMAHGETGRGGEAQQEWCWRRTGALVVAAPALLPLAPLFSSSTVPVAGHKATMVAACNTLFFREK